MPSSPLAQNAKNHWQKAIWENISGKKYCIALIYAMLLGIFLTLLTYPGILYSDSYTRVMAASQYLNGEPIVTMWVTFFPSLVMAFFTIF